MTTDDYNILIDKCISLATKDGNYDEAIKCFEKVLDIKPDDPDALKYIGISWANIGKHNKAINFYDKALEFIPEDSDLLRRKGVSLARKGKHDEAFNCYDKALDINPNDPKTLRNKGTLLADKGDHYEAIKCFKTAIDFDENDFESMRDMGTSYLSLGKQDEALQWINEALDINSNDPFANLILAKIEFERRHSERGTQAFKKAMENLEPVDKKNVNILSALSFFWSYRPEILKELNLPPIYGESKEYEFSGLLGVVKKAIETKPSIVEGFLSKMEETDERLSEFITGPSLLKNDSSLFLTLRKWNSYTPIIPTNKHERSVGGGYFIFHKGKGTIIDPGYNFIDNFFRAGGRIVDIENIVLTHAHDDHTSNFEPLLSLIHQYNEKTGDEFFKRITVYANTGSFKKFCTILDLKEDYIKWVYVLSPGIRFELDDDLFMEAVHAYHKERITNKYAVGLKFVFGKGANQKTMLFTSDTGLLPNSSKDKKPEIWKTYPRSDDINVLIVHLGSIRDTEFKPTLLSNMEDVLYPNHLGYIGTMQVIYEVGPKLAIISEFGEELSDFQKPLVDLITMIVKELCNERRKHEPKVLPADLPLIYDVFSEQIYCIYTKQMVEVSKIEFKLPNLSDDPSDPSDDKRFYYCNKEIIKKDDDIVKKAKEFEKELAERTGLYFKTEIDAKSHY